MSGCTRPTVAAKSAVAVPTQRTTSGAVPERSKSAWLRATMYTPAVTMVAAWMSAETGVGPSIASGNHVWSGSWADLPHAPMNRSSAMPVAVAGASVSAPLNTAVLQRAQHGPEPHDAEAEAEVAHTVHDERLLPRLGRRRTRVPEPDQQVRAEPHRFPEDVQEQEVAGDDEHRHREHEQVQVREVTRVTRIAVHVADRVEVNERADARDDEEHHAGERVDERDDPRLKPPGDDPREESAREAPAVPRAREHRARCEERARHGGDRHPVGPPSDAIAEEDVDERARKRKSGDEPDGRHRVMLARGRSGCQASGRPRGWPAWYHRFSCRGGLARRSGP